ncbi:MFS transporter [Streptomyces chartreusis]|uniref:hypothetical protein n=1 Tax=Streptomyces chartreusis TaxID=1969 RepID=UPI00363D766F
MTLAAGVLLDGKFWGGVAQWCLIAIGLFILARAAAFAVTPRVVWDYQLPHWWLLAWTGWLLLVLASIPWTLFNLTGDRSSASTAAGTGMLIFGVVVFAALGVALSLPKVMSLPVPNMWFVTLAVLAAGCMVAYGTDAPVRGYTATGTVSAVGVLMFGFALGTRLKLRITVLKDGKEDPISTAYAVTRMAAMGHKARGLEAPKGTDASLPQDAVAALPQEGRTAVALTRIALSLFAIAPWRANIALTDEKTATVTLRRNGATADATIIFRSELGLNGFEPPPGAGDFKTVCEQDVLTAAGSFLFLCMERSHPALRDGLCGARHWRSLACQILAGTPPWAGNSQAAQELLARAVDKDPNNSAARLAYLVSRYGSMAEAQDDQESYIKRLQRFHRSIERKDDNGNSTGYLPLHVRTLWMLITARVNYAALAGNSSGARAEQYKKAWGSLNELEGLLTDLAGKKVKKRELEEFYELVEPNYRILRAQVAFELRRSNAPDLTQDELRRRNILSLRQDEMPLLASYNLACLNTVRGNLNPAFEDLDFALGLKANRKDIAIDPVLRPLMEKLDTKMMTLLDMPKLSEIGVLQPHADKLKRDGICYPAELLARSTEEAQIKELAESLDVPISTVAWMHGVCELVVSCPDPQQAVAWTDLLTRDGVDTRQALNELDEAEIERLEKLAWTAGAVPLTRERLKTWADAIA